MDGWSLVDPPSYWAKDDPPSYAEATQGVEREAQAAPERESSPSNPNEVTCPLISDTVGSQSQRQIPSSRSARGMVNDQCFECRSRGERFDWHDHLSDKSLSYPKYCQECKALHPLAYFPRVKRRHQQPERCIGRQGFIRLCEHKTLRWCEVVEAVYRLPKDHPKSGGPTRTRLLRCQDPNHLRGARPSGGNRPTIFLERSRTGIMQLVMEWTTDLLSPRSDNTHGRENHMRIFRIGTPAEFIAPEARPGLLLEMKPLDSLLNNPNIGSHTSKTPLNHSTEPTYGISIKISRSGRSNCHNHNETVLKITYRRTILITSWTSTCTTSITHSWFSALDPLSYPSTRDEIGKRQWDGLGCWMNKNCANYVGYFDRPGLKRAVDGFREWKGKERDETISDLEVCRDFHRRREARLGGEGVADGIREWKGKERNDSDLEVSGDFYRRRERRLRGETVVQTVEVKGVKDWIRNNQMAWERRERKRVEREERRRKWGEIKMGDSKSDNSRTICRASGTIFDHVTPTEKAVVVWIAVPFGTSLAISDLSSQYRPSKTQTRTNPPVNQHTRWGLHKPKLPANLTKEISKGRKTWWGEIDSLFKLVKENAGAQVNATKVTENIQA
ncbi:hypothetical protein OQA88_4229, partial [Cercophora sp. LCS_1]